MAQEITMEEAKLREKQAYSDMTTSPEFPYINLEFKCKLVTHLLEGDALELARMKLILLDGGKIERRRVGTANIDYFQRIGCHVSSKGFDTTIVVATPAALETLKNWRDELDTLRKFLDDLLPLYRKRAKGTHEIEIEANLTTPAILAFLTSEGITQVGSRNGVPVFKVGTGWAMKVAKESGRRQQAIRGAGEVMNCPLCCVPLRGHECRYENNQ